MSLDSGQESFIEWLDEHGKRVEGVQIIGCRWKKDCFSHSALSHRELTSSQSGMPLCE